MGSGFNPGFAESLATGASSLKKAHMRADSLALCDQLNVA